MNSRRKKSPSSKARRKSPAGPHCRAVQTSRSSPGDKRKNGAAQQRRPTALRAEFRAILAELPTRLERDTSLTPEWVAEGVVQEAERFLKADLPADFAERLAAKAYHCYDHHRQFHKLLNEPGNRGREALFMFMRHWTAGWLRRERPALHKLLPHSYGLGQKLPVR